MSNMRARQKKFFAERLEGQLAAANYASDTSGVADFEHCVASDAPAPVIQAAVDIDMGSVLMRQPKYEEWPELSNKYVPGTPLFAASNKVQWVGGGNEPSLSQNAVRMATATPRNVR